VFDNDFPALLPSSPPLPADDLLVAEAESGACRVICYGPDHHRGLADLSVDETEHIMRLQKAESAALMADPAIAAVFVFENRGDMMGASSPHPHAQIWATSSVPGELAREVRRQSAYQEANGRPLLLDYARREISERVRIVAEDDHFIAVVPFWAAWPFETLILPLRSAATLQDLNDADLRSLSRLLGTLTRAYDNLFDCPFPYTFGWHQAPKGVSADDGFTLHAHFFPPLLRSATVRKHMVGFEMLAGAQRDLTAEAAAERLRSVLP
jgi:UDPglucose--hexose-1-phosphate uridylyltransferase